MNRRNFVRMSSTAAFAPSLSLISEVFGVEKIACQQYPWHTFFDRDDRKWEDDLAFSIRGVLDAGFTVFEPLISSLDYLEDLVALIDKDLLCPSLYVNSTLHDANQTEASTKEVLAIARAAQQAWGTRIIVTNPSPIAWGGSEDKDDDQLRTQAQALDHLGKVLKAEDMVLAYHNHDAEMRHSAREFHHMMLGTDPAHVKLCLDAHWIYRGAGNSSVALFDIINMYLERVVELHLRQSHDGVWCEYFRQEGDINYVEIASLLQDKNMSPHLVLEQAVEKGTPTKLSAVKAHNLSKKEVGKIF